MSDIGIQSAGYTNQRYQLDPTPFPASQSWGMSPPVELLNQSGTVGWTTIDVSRIVPSDATFVYLYIEWFVPTTAIVNATMEVRRDAQPDSAVYRLARMALPFGEGNTVGTFGMAPITTAGGRTFDIQVTGAFTGSAAYRIELRGYSTNTRNTANGNQSSDGSGEAGGLSDAPIGR